MPSLPSDRRIPERRTQARVLVEIPISVTVRGRPEPWHGQTIDLSWGGVLFTLPDPLPKTARTMRIGLPWRDGQSITTEALLLRSTHLADGRVLLAARFTSLSPQDHKRLERLLRLLVRGAGGGRFGPAELVRTLVVNANDSRELRQMLNEIATGRHRVTVFESYAVGQSIAFSLAGTQETEEISLRARVVEVRNSAITGAEWAHLHDITVEFEHPLDAIRALIQHTKTFVPGDGQNLETAPDTPATAPPTSRAGSAQASGQPCAIEAQFPALMEMLTTVWADPAAFGQLLQVLLLGNQSQPGGWPLEVWDELVLLRGVHAEAYGTEQGA